MDNEQRIQAHNDMVRGLLRAEEQAETDRRLRKREAERITRQINCVQNRTKGQSDREKWGHKPRLNTPEASSESFAPHIDHVDDASHTQ